MTLERWGRVLLMAGWAVVAVGLVFLLPARRGVGRLPGGISVSTTVLLNLLHRR